MSKQFDVSPEQQTIVEQKAARRLFLRNEFLKLKTDPFQYASGEGGCVFDPAIQRYNAMKVNEYDYFRPTGRNALFIIGCGIIPMFVAKYLMNKSRANLEAAYRRGEVSYKDRGSKFI